MQLKVGVSKCLSMWRILFLIILECFCGIYAKKCDFKKEGCGRVPAAPLPTVIPTTTMKTINDSVRGIACTSAETRRTGCLNRGTCFVLVIGEERNPSCHCSTRYTGIRCQELNFEFLFPTKENTIAKAGIAASIGVLVVITIVFVAVAIVYYRRRKQERQDQSVKGMRRWYINANGGGQLLPENHIRPNPITRYKNDNSHFENYINFEEMKPLTHCPYQATAV